MTTVTRLELIDDLYHTSRPEARCPHLAHCPEHGCYCKSPELPSPSDRFAVCDPYSLQLWCLDSERWEKCHFFPT